MTQIPPQSSVWRRVEEARDWDQRDPRIASAEADFGTAPWAPPWRRNPEHAHGGADWPAPPQAATGHYGAGYGDPMRHGGNDMPARAEPIGRPARPSQPGTGDELLPPFPEAHRHEGEGDRHYRRLRSEHERELDADYAAWRQQRFDDEFRRWRDARQQAQRASPVVDTSLIEPSATGRAERGGGGSDTTNRNLGARDTGAPTEDTQTFFERS